MKINGVLISDGNRKLGRIPSFSMEPLLTCGRGLHGKLLCMTDCYAMKMKRYTSVAPGWRRNAELWFREPATVVFALDAFLHRLFIRASKTGKITWPEPTHAKGTWRPASEIIDWSVKGQCLSERKHPLKENTLKRIEAGLRKFGGEPFIAVLRGTSDSQKGAWAKGLDEPLGTVTAGGGHQALCEPFIVQTAHAGGDRVRGCNEPLPTIPAGHRGELSLCEPFIVPQMTGGKIRGVDEPLQTLTTTSRGVALVEPFIVPMEHSGRQPVRSCGVPLPTITTAKGGSFGLAEPFVVKYYGTGGARPVNVPLDTVTAKGRFALVEPFKMGIRFRMLQPHELAKAMGFDGYEFCGNKTEVVRQVGNAVSVRAAKAITGAILDQLRN